MKNAAERYTRQFVDEAQRFIVDYDDTHRKRGQCELSIYDCNNFWSLLDCRAAQLSKQIIDHANAKNTYFFGMALPSYPYMPETTLYLKACDCPSYPNTASAKSEARRKARIWIESWLKGAQDWLVKGCPFMEHTGHNNAYSEQAHYKLQKAQDDKSESKRAYIIKYRPI